MADFIKAFKITILGNEGGYNPGIGEKETYKGIDRGANPDWSGWKVVDAIKTTHEDATTKQINTLLAANIPLQSNIASFYKVNYWDTINLDKVNDQQLADNLFDCSVNQGEGLARKFMQLACNYVMAAVKVAITPLAIDGKIGALTLAVFNSLPAAQLNANINAEREASYHTDSEYAEWGKVWEKRLVTYT
jgi:lysozyme family protein